MFRFCSVVLACAASLAAADFTEAKLRPDGARFSSELTIYDEALRGGRLVGRYWSPIGRVRADKEIKDAEFASPWADAFAIEVGGNAVSPKWNWVGAKTEGAETVVELRHASDPLTVRVHTKLDGTAVLMRWLEITNTSDKPMPLSGLAPFSGQLWRIWWHRQLFPKRIDPPFRVAWFRHATWGEEGDFGWSAVPYGEFSFDNGRTGKSGWGNPFFIARNEASGEYFVCAPGWSGEWKMEFLRGLADGNAQESLYVRARMISTDPAMRVIAPGETVTSPVVHIGHLTGELDDVVQAMHEHIRRSVAPPQIAGRAQLVQDNHWGYQSGIETEEGVKAAVDAAARVGVELYIFDAGWYGNKRNDWPNQTGDWRAGPWLPRGLKPISDYVHSKGLLFGLWLEAESIGKSTKIREQHPEFVLLRNGQPAYGGRALDLTKPEVAAWLESELTRVFTENGVDLFRLDYNVTDSHGGGNHVRDGYIENTTWRHYEAFYAMLERLRKKFPRIIFENCAGGGARTDLGILRYMHTTWISDMNVLPKSVKILNGMTMLLPPELCNRNFGTQWDIQRQYGDLDTQLRVTLLAHPSGIGIAPSLADMNPANARRVAHAIELYKTFIRPMLSTSRVYHHTPEMPYETPGDWLALEYAARDRARAYAGVFRLSSEGLPEYVLRPRGLRPSTSYRVTFDNSGESITKTGYELNQQGIRIRLAGGIRSELVLFEATKQ